jgi:hypothetical protein
MKNLLSLALAIAFSVSNWAACGIGCDHTSQPSLDHAASLHSLHTEHAHNHSGEPLVSAGQHFCGTHAEGEAVFSPKRGVQVDKLTALAEIPSASNRDRLPNFSAQLDRAWQSGFPLSPPPGFSLRI